MKQPINNCHLTAKERDKLSFPANWLLRNKLLNGRILDFGCGFGSDVKYLKEIGNSIIGYDPYYLNKYPTEKFDTIFCIYVLNVLEQRYQAEVLMQVSELLKEGGKAFFAVRRDLKTEGFRIHKIYKKTTYQCNVLLPFKSIFLNEFCEIYEYQHFTSLERNANACIFCKPTSKLKFITESATVYAVYDGYPVSRGHALIIPKRHISNYFDLTEHEQKACWLVVNHVKEIITNNFNPDGFNVGFNVNKAAGQSIFHVHIHIIPRYFGDVKNPRGGIRHVIGDKGNY
jgi:diadenosine tetraphosphate (Ap4A) HIT family hydrolase